MIKFENIKFTEECHKYEFLNRPDLFPISVTGLISKITKPFDSEFWSRKKAIEFNITQNEILEQWKRKGDLAAL